MSAKHNLPTMTSGSRSKRIPNNDRTNRNATARSTAALGAKLARRTCETFSLKRYANAPAALPGIKP
jgi:hypothetical protein